MYNAVTGYAIALRCLTYRELFKSITEERSATTNLQQCQCQSIAQKRQRRPKWRKLLSNQNDDEPDYDKERSPSLATPQ